MKDSEITEKDDENGRVAERDEDFVSRWSRKKHEARQAESDAVGSEDSSRQALKEGPPGEEPGPELTDEDMPALDELDQDSDFSPFLSKGVSDGLRQAALRKLFRSPKFNVCDGLDDYAEDYTKFAPLGDIITADMKHQMQRALEKLEAMAEASEGETPDPAAQRSAQMAESDAEAVEGEGARSDGPSDDLKPEEKDDDRSRA